MVVPIGFLSIGDRVSDWHSGDLLQLQNDFSFRQEILEDEINPGALPVLCRESDFAFMKFYGEESLCRFIPIILRASDAR